MGEHERVRKGGAIFERNKVTAILNRNSNLPQSAPLAFLRQASAERAPGDARDEHCDDYGRDEADACDEPFCIAGGDRLAAKRGEIANE